MRSFIEREFAMIESVITGFDGLLTSMA